MNILIVDDEPLARFELSYLIKEHPGDKVIEEADSIECALEKMLDQKPDVLFLDIHLTGENGFELAEKLLHLKKPPYLIFATAYDDYALKAFEVNANDYILKPFEERTVHQALDKFQKQFQTTEVQPAIKQKPEPEVAEYDSIPIQGHDRIFLVKPEDIYLVSVEERQVSIITRDQVYEMSRTLKEIEQKLPKEYFLKTHRSYILNTTKIKEIQPWFNNTYQVTLQNDVKVPVSRTYTKSLKDRIGL